MNIVCNMPGVRPRCERLEARCDQKATAYPNIKMTVVSFIFSKFVSSYIDSARLKPNSFIYTLFHCFSLRCGSVKPQGYLPSRMFISYRPSTSKITMASATSPSTYATHSAVSPEVITGIAFGTVMLVVSILTLRQGSHKDCRPREQ